MVDFPANCRACGGQNIITLPEGEILKTEYCDEKVCSICGKKGMNYPKF